MSRFSHEHLDMSHDDIYDHFADRADYERKVRREAGLSAGVSVQPESEKALHRPGPTPAERPAIDVEEGNE